MHPPRTVEWLYRTQSSSFPFRWTNMNCCPRSLLNSDLDGISSNICFGRDPNTDGRSTSLPSLKHTTSDGKNDATCASLREANKDDDTNFSCKETKPDLNSGECPQDETAAVVTYRDENLDWQEERKQWISAAGVSTPSELELKIEDMRRAVAKTEADFRELTCHVAEVKSFLLQLQDMDQKITKRKKRFERKSRRRKRFRRECSVAECSCGMSDNEKSSTERATEQGGGSLLDPQIMKSFGSLIKSSA